MAIGECYFALPNPDANFVPDFQTSNFGSRLFELYLIACFREQGLSVRQDMDLTSFGSALLFLPSEMKQVPLGGQNGTAVPSEPADRLTGLSSEGNATLAVLHGPHTYTTGCLPETMAHLEGGRHYYAPVLQPAKRHPIFKPPTQRHQQPCRGVEVIHISEPNDLSPFLVSPSHHGRPNVKYRRLREFLAGDLTMHKLHLVLAAGITCAFALGASSETDVAPDGIESSQYSSAEAKEILSTDFANLMLRADPKLAFSDDHLEFWINKAKEAHQGLQPATIDPSHTYDIVIQVGHFPRKTGVTGGQGQHLSEQQMAALISTLIRDQLKPADIDIILIDADGNPNLKSKIFLALHTDGNTSADGCSIGPSIGYDDESDADDMKYVAAATAMSLGYELDSFQKDNYTEGLRYYYGYKIASTELFEGVLEMAVHSCRSSEENLIGNAAILARNLAIALQFSLKPVEL